MMKESRYLCSFNDFNIMKVVIDKKIKAECILWLNETGSPTKVIRKYHSKYGRNANAPSRSQIRSWFNAFKDTGCVNSTLTGGRKLRVNNDVVDTLKDLYEGTPTLSLRHAAQHVTVSKSSVQRVLKKTLNFYPYKIQVVHALKPADFGKREEFARTVLTEINRDPTFLQKNFFSDEATFHVSGIVNRHNVRIWGTENPRAIHEVERNSPKVNVWCGLFHDMIIGPYFFNEATINQGNFLNMLLQFAFPQVRDRQPGVIFQLDGAPPHWGLGVRRSLHTEFPGLWIGRGGPYAWPPR